MCTDWVVNYYGLTAPDSLINDSTLHGLMGFVPRFKYCTSVTVYFFWEGGGGQGLSLGLSKHTRLSGH